jgi:hypothetical protein
MENISNDDFIKLLNIALKDENINNYEFKMLLYIFNNSDFMVSDLKRDLRISSFNMISKFLKNLVKENYVIKISKHLKNCKNVGSYNYFINVEKLQLQNNNKNTLNNAFLDNWNLYYYFFEKIPTNKKVDKNLNLKQITLLLEFDNYPILYLKNLIDFVANDEQLKYLYSRPLSFRKNIKEIISLYENKNQITSVKEN